MKIYDSVPTSLEETTQAMTAYESDTFCQMNIAEPLSKISVGNDGGYINLRMTTRAASPYGNWKLIMSIVYCSDEQSINLHGAEWF